MEGLDSFEKPYMTDYDIFAKFYDTVMGSREKTAAEVWNLVKEHHPQAKTILELAVGTGTNLVPLSADYEVSGLDLSEKMLEVAKTKLPEAKFYHQDMVNFELQERFDVILCLFDSVNHLLNFEQWKQMFQNVREHLNENGVFIFDVNTPVKLERVVNDKPFVKEFEGNRMEMTVQSEDNGIVNWNVKFQEAGNSLAQEENIKEVAFPKEEIAEALEQVFSSVDVKAEPRPDTGVVERIYFSCKK